MNIAADAGPHAQQEADRPVMALPGKYVSVTSFRADGTPVATSVWLVQDDGRLLVEADAAFCKVERIRRNPAVLPNGDRGRQPWPTRPQVANRWPSPAISTAWSARPVPASPTCPRPVPDPFVWTRQHAKVRRRVLRNLPPVLDGPRHA